MNPLLKTRSDYRHLKVVERPHSYFTLRWSLPILCVLFGFALGMMFSKRESTFKREILALSASDQVMMTDPTESSEKKLVNPARV